MNDVDISQAISKLQSMAAAAHGHAAPKTDVGNADDFGAVLKDAIDNVSDIQQKAGSLSDAFEKGDPQTNLTEVMVALQKAKISFQAMVEVRNKLVVAYQDIMNMQI